MTEMMRQVTETHWAEAYESARQEVEMIREATSPVEEITTEPARYFLSDDEMSGLVVRESGEVVGLFSRVKGRGDALVIAAIENGGRTLDCFDGYLPTLYGRHGFEEVKREANWTPGGPDVVFMELVA